MTIHEIRTPLLPEEVLEQASLYFALVGTPYAMFPAVLGARYIALRAEVAEMVISAVRQDGTTLVRGSASRGEHLLSGFISSLAPPLDARRTIRRHGEVRISGALTESFSPGKEEAPAAEIESAVGAAA